MPSGVMLSEMSGLLAPTASMRKAGPPSVPPWDAKPSWLLKVVPPNGEIIDALRAAGMLAVPAAENVVRLLPPLIIGDDQVDEALEALTAVCAARVG